MHAHGYERPYVAEIEGRLADEAGHARGSENFLQDAHTVRVLTIDEYARETYHEPGWVEEHLRPEGEQAPKIPKDYVARTVDEMSAPEIAKWERDFREYAHRADGPSPSVEAVMQRMKEMYHSTDEKIDERLNELREEGTLYEPNLTAAGDFDESKHPRDARGRFGEVGWSDAQAMVAEASKGTPYGTRSVERTARYVEGRHRRRSSAPRP
jgi:hypothetical protein